MVCCLVALSRVLFHTFHAFCVLYGLVYHTHTYFTRFRIPTLPVSLHFTFRLVRSLHSLQFTRFWFSCTCLCILTVTSRSLVHLVSCSRFRSSHSTLSGWFPLLLYRLRFYLRVCTRSSHCAFWFLSVRTVWFTSHIFLHGTSLTLSLRFTPDVYFRKHARGSHNTFDSLRLAAQTVCIHAFSFYLTRSVYASLVRLPRFGWFTRFAVIWFSLRSRCCVLSFALCGFTSAVCARLLTTFSHTHRARHTLTRNLTSFSCTCTCCLGLRCRSTSYLFTFTHACRFTYIVCAYLL